MSQLFESWSLSRPQIPQRTLAYSLTPVGIGTAMMESLSSYVSRLAEAHCVTVGDLVGRTLAEVPNPKGTIVTSAARAFRAGGHGFRACGYAINGTTERTARWVYALEAISGRHDLSYLTLLSLRFALPQRIFRRHRAWCPACFEHWRSTGQTVYEPLAWAFELVPICSVHKCPLRNICHCCNRKLTPFSVISRMGYCQQCGEWLGEPGPERELSKTDPAKEALWTSENIGELLTILPMIDPGRSRGFVRRNLISYLDEVFEGNILALAKHIKRPPSILQSWLRGVRTPSFENLVRTAQALDVSLLGFFTAETPTIANIAAARRAVKDAGPRNVAPSRSASDLRIALQAALTDNVPLSLSAVARNLGYTGTERLYQADRKLCHKIAARFRQSDQGHWWKKPGAARICEAARLKEMLEESLRSPESTSVCHISSHLGYSNAAHIRKQFPELCTAIGRKIAHEKRSGNRLMRRVLEKALREYPAPSLAELARRLRCTTSSILRMHEPDLCDQLLAHQRRCIEERRSDLRKAAESVLEESPVPSVRSVCQRLGITIWFMNRYFPDVRRRISEQHRRCSLAETLRQRELLFQEVRDIARELYRRGLYPSAVRIMDCIPEGLSCEWMTVNMAVRDAQEALGASQ